jgi:hypothetical protein
MKYGPTRGELWFRLGFSLAGLVLLGFAFRLHGFGGMAMNEVFVIATVFFAGTAGWSVWRLFGKQDKGS